MLVCWLSGVRCRTAGCVSRMLHVMQHPSSWIHSLLFCTWPPTTSKQALHTIGGNNKYIVSNSWWWAQKCPKHVEHIISAINNSVAYVGFSFLRKNSYVCGKSNHISSIIKPEPAHSSNSTISEQRLKKNYKTRINFNIIHLLSCRRLTLGY